MSSDLRASPFLQRLRSLRTLAGTLVVAVVLQACAYRIDIQQGNLLEEEALDQIQLGMSRSAVQFLLGTPMVADTFHEQRWDYAYYFRRGREREVEQRWIVVYFEQDRVVRIERDLELRPAS
jgi:outer membrane protein assembly factor BamE